VPSFAVILPAAGKSSRFRDPHYKKPFVPLDNRPVWLHAAEKFTNRSDVQQTLLVISPEDREAFQSKIGANAALLGIEIVDGGAERTDSVANALARVRADIDFVAIHDAARPCIAEEWIDSVFAAAVKSGRTCGKRRRRRSFAASC
jgi:2-C-methyl-D-erythritol 4-phosphate cytidylyltransferase